MSHSTAAAPSTQNVRRLDIYAMCISGLCLIHCLALPLSVLPLAAALSENEWVHRIMVLLAIPATAIVIRAARIHRLFVTAALTGLALLLIGAFVEPLEAYETWLTVAGSICLASAHLWHHLAHRPVRLGHQPAVEQQGDVGA